MAAIDPSAEAEYSGMANGDGPVRATLKLIRQPIGPDDEDSEDDSEDDDYMDALLNGDASEEDDDESSSDDEEKNGGPSDPSKSRKARRQAAVEQLKKALAEDGSDDDIDMDGTNGLNGTLTKLDKGKAKATGGEDEDDSDEGDSEDLEVEEFVICTLDPTQVCYSPRRSPTLTYTMTSITNSLLTSLSGKMSVFSSKCLARIRSISLATM